jgi:2-C-methyl-D-erythritol 2,4-cyclodiphosphate synthase
MKLRIGHGYDIHRLQSGGELVLGGVVVSQDMSAVAHSDGDVVLHALADALLGALGRGDIGEHFPNSDPAYKNVASVVFIEKIKTYLAAEQGTVANIDITVLAERPKLQAFKAKMAAFVSALLSCPVNVKAGTNEGMDAIGRGEAIAAHAVVLVSILNPASSTIAPR